MGMRRTFGTLAGAAMLLVTESAGAMVPVNIQQRGHLKAIIDLPSLNDFFPISRIELIAPDTWRLTAGRCHVDVRMVATRGPGHGLTGPRFEPRAGRRVCTR